MSLKSSVGKCQYNCITSLYAIERCLRNRRACLARMRFPALDERLQAFAQSSDWFIELFMSRLIVVEKVMTKFYGVQQIKKYVPTIINVVRERKYTVNPVV